MSKLFLPGWFQMLLAAMVLLVATTSWAVGDERFAVALGAHDTLVIFGPKGERVAEFGAPTISQPVTVGTTSFQVSYGRDADDLLTAILAPGSSQPQDLHFNVSNKSIDADKEAVVTLTFHGANRVTVDPGYVGSVVVNSQNVMHRSLAEDSHVSRPVVTPPPAPRTAIDVQPRNPAPPAPREQAPSIAPAAKPSVSHESAAPVSPEPAPAVSSTPLPVITTVAGSADDAPPLPAPPPLIGGMPAQPPLPYSLNSSAVVPPASASSSSTKEKLYWAEPVTPPKGPPPTVALNQMKLIEVHGPVSVKMADGETKTGENGMIVPSGSIIITTDNASAAVFMGGVNSARLMPKCELKITQDMNGTVRKTTLDLERGAVFSRIGHRPGETQDYQIRTPEGVAAARGTEMLAFRGSMEDLKPAKTTLNAGLAWARNRLLAWNPTSLGHGQMSDVANPMLAAAASGNNHFYVFVAKGTVECRVNGQIFKVISGQGSELGVTVMPPTDDAGKILQAILEILQPLNVKLEDLLIRINNHTASAADLVFYKNLIVIFFDNQLPSIVQEFEDYPNPFLDILPLARRALNQDLQPFGTNPLTPF